MNVAIKPQNVIAGPALAGKLSLVSGSTVTLGWSAGSGPITSYVVEAGSATGRTDLGSFDTGSTAGSAP